MTALTRFLGLLYGGLALVLAVLVGGVVGTLGLLPILPLPRWKRARYGTYVAALWSRIVVRILLLTRVRVTGDVQLEPGEGALVIANHRSWTDPPLLIGWCQTQALSKRQIAYIPIIGLYGYLSGTIFFDRSSKAARQKARDNVLASLKAGNRITIFPEGTRTRTGELREKVYLTLIRDCWEHGLRVVPAAVFHTEDVLPTSHHAAYPLQRVRLDIGPPIAPADYTTADDFAKAAWQQVVNRVTSLQREDP